MVNVTIYGIHTDPMGISILYIYITITVSFYVSINGRNYIISGLEWESDRMILGDGLHIHGIKICIEVVSWDDMGY